MDIMIKKEYNKPEVVELSTNLTDGSKGVIIDVENPGTQGNKKSPS